MTIVANTRCEVAEPASLAELRESHILTKRPFVYRGFFSADEQPWSDDVLVELIGGAKVPVFYTGGSQSAFTDGRMFVQVIPFRELLEREDAGIRSSGYVLAKDIAEDLREFYQRLEVPDIVKNQQCNLWYSRRPNLTRLHYDRADNFVRVLRGTKVFTILPPAAPAHASPFWGNGNVNFSKVDAAPDFDKHGGYRVELEPGDLFYLPRSWWHHVVSSPGAAVNFWWDETPHTHWSEFRQQGHHFVNRGLRKLLDRGLKRSLSTQVRSGPRSLVSRATLQMDGQSVDVEVLKLGVGVMYVRRAGATPTAGDCRIEFGLPQSPRPVSCKGIVRLAGLDDDLAEILFDEVSADDTDRLVALVTQTQSGCLPGEI